MQTIKQRKYMLYAYATKEDEIPGFAMSKRIAQTVRRLMTKLRQVDMQ